MTVLNPDPPIITWSVNSLNAPTSGQKFSGDMKISRSNYVLSVKNALQKQKDGKILCANMNQKKTWVAILIPGKVDFRAKEFPGIKGDVTCDKSQFTTKTYKPKSVCI